MIPTIDVILTINTENILFALLPIIAIAITICIVPLGIATLITTIETVTLKEYKHTIQCVCLVTNILILTFYITFLTFIITTATHLPEIQ